MKTKIYILSLLLSLISITTLLGQKNLKGITIGEIAPDFELPNTQDSIIKLSDLRGNVVLIDFWATWCSPCRQKNPRIKQIYDNHKDNTFKNGEKELIVLFVSLDKNKTIWEQTIANDSIGMFTHVSDLKGWRNVAAKKYNVKKIPATLLIDGEGRILAINPSTRELEKKLRKLRKFRIF